MGDKVPKAEGRGGVTDGKIDALGGTGRVLG